MIFKLSLLVIFITVASCMPRKVVVIDRIKVKNISDVKLIKNITDSEIQYHNLYYKKFDVKAKIDSKEYSFKGSLNIAKDSQIVVSVMPLMGIEMFRIAFFSDSIFLIDRLKKVIHKTDYSYFRKNYSIDLDYLTLQSMLTNRIFCYPYDYEGLGCLKKLKSYEKDNFYSLQSLRSHKVSRIDRKEVLDQIFQEFLIIPEIFRISTASIQKLNTNDLLLVNYGAFNDFDGVVFPSLIKIKGTHDLKEFIFDFNINSLVKNGEQQLMFNVPEKYHINIIN